MSKIFRVFFSSTFSDFKAERNALQSEEFKKLKKLCATYGARFQPIDLRWGIPAEVGLQQSTMQTCLEEIKRCQNITPRPNFLIFLGDRYGWTPPPAKIPKTEYDIISGYFTEKEKILIEEWYKLDENELCRLDVGTITSIYELQPRGETYKHRDKWKPIEKNLRNILLEAAKKSKLSEKQMVKYYASATHQEIVMGALEANEVDTHVHCFFRKLNGLPDGAKSEVYIESDSEKIKYLSNLKIELQQKLPLNIHKYEVDLGDEKDKENHLKKFCNDVFRSLKITILKELEDMEEISALDEEIDAHIKFGKTRTRVFVGREEILNDIIDYVERDKRVPFVIYGEPGSGKSALLSKVLEKLEKEKKDAEYIFRFIGTTPSSSDSIRLLRSICEQIINKYKIEFEEEIPFEYNELKETFSKLFGLIQGGKKAVILLDALDQLPRKDEGRDLTWLPQELPENVKLITSFATDDSDIMNNLRKMLPSSLHELKRLSPEEGNMALKILLENALRRLTPDQKDMVLQKFSENGLPLYLKLAFEESCTWNSYDKLDCIKLAPDVEGLIQILFERLYEEHTQMTVERILCYIVAARNGLTEDEILDVMTSDPDYFNWYKEEQIHHELPEEKLPWIVWSRLHFDLEPYLTIHGVDKTSTIVFFHRQFNETIQRIFLSKIAEDRHRVLANYFNNVDLYFQKNGTKIPNYRKLSELVYNLRKAKLWEHLESNLTNLEFIEAKCLAVMTDDLLMDYNRSLNDLISKDMYDKYIKSIQEFKQFVSSQAHILRKYPHLTVQQALNQPDILTPSRKGWDIFKSASSPKLVFEWVNKLQVPDPCILTLEGHNSPVLGCAFSPDGTMALTASTDKTLKLWNIETGIEIRTFEGHLDKVIACAFSSDGTMILSASEDNTLKLWDVERGLEIKTFKGHSHHVKDCNFSPDGTTILSASNDSSLKLWDIETGTEIKTLEGHNFPINGCKFSPDGSKILSAANDMNLKLWNTITGNEIKKFEGHSASVLDCNFSPDGTKILSASSDNTLKLWVINSGTEIRTFEGHSSNVNAGIFSLEGNKILSASDDKTLRLWNTKTGMLIKNFKGHSYSVKDCEFSPDGKTLLSVSLDGLAKIWNVETPINTGLLEGHDGAVYACTFSKDGSQIISSGLDGKMNLWDIKTFSKIRTFEGHYYDISNKKTIIRDVISGCSFSPDGTKILSAGDCTLKLWDVETGVELRIFKGHSHWVQGCTFSPDGTKILSSSCDGTLKLWDAETGADIRTFIGHSGYIEMGIFSPDGRRILSASRDNFLKLWNLQTGDQIKTFKGHTNWVMGCDFSPDGKMIASASNDNTLKIWDVETGREIRTIRGFSSTVFDCSFSPDGTKILSISDSLKLWDVETGAELMIFPTLGRPYKVSIGAHNLIAVGDAIGKIYLLRFYGISFNPVIVTPIRIYNFKTKSFNKEFSVNCKWCGDFISLDDDMLYEKSDDHPEGCLDEVIECPSCHKSLKLTSFFVGKR